MHIRPYSKNPAYWEYKGQPVLLLGGSVEDNLFQIPDLVEHLDLLASVGGNYVRCTMSSRDPGDAWPFERDEKTGLYDLDRLGQDYWQRFRTFVELCEERGIILQIELWDRFDFAREPWQQNPFNPKNNSTYSADESGLQEVYDQHPGAKQNGFFRSVPDLENNTLVLKYQETLVDALLEITLPRPNVLYCMDNETNEDPAWPSYWARYIRRKADAAGQPVCLTEMWDEHDILAPMHENTWKHPEIYDFCDISQNNHQPSATHAGNFLAFREKIHSSGKVRPINCVKTYGANTGAYGTNRDGTERFWRSIFCGAAASRFHRPDSGLGLSANAQCQIRSARLFANAFDVFSAEPATEALRHKSYNEAYAMENSCKQAAVYFPDGGDVFLSVDEGSSEVSVRWLDIRRSAWHDRYRVATNGGEVRLTTPVDTGYWLGLVEVPT